MDIKMLAGAVRDIGQAVINMQKEVSHIRRQADETRKAVDEILKGLFGISKQAPSDGRGMNQTLSRIFDGLAEVNDQVNALSSSAPAPAPQFGGSRY
jgi:methyl-accepting chemotaxis protein